MSTANELNRNEPQVNVDLPERVEEIASELADRAEEISESARFGARTMVKAYPGPTIGAAVVFGFLLGALWRRVG